MIKNKKNQHRKKWLLGIAAFLIVVTFCIWPTNYVIDSPGQASQISQYVKTNAAKANPNFYLVTVSERPAVMIDYLTSFLRPFDTRYSRQEVMGDANSQEYEQMQRYYMETSQNNAIYYAAKKAGVQHQQKYLGVYVMEVMSQSHFKNKLKVGDIVTKVNDCQFKSTPELMAYVNRQKAGSKLKVTVQRHGKTHTYTGQTIKLPGTKRSGIGIQLVDHTEVQTKPAIRIDAGDIGGPSAGLMFSLECYQIFAKKTLSKHKIAGTGTIDADGKVGMIGGVDKKVVAADKEGCQVFFAPTDRPGGVKKNETNYAEAVKAAKKIKTKMKIVPVATFEDALHYLQTNH